MENEHDIRWIQRLSNYKKAVKKITEAVSIIKGDVGDNNFDDYVDELLKEGVIQRFEYTHELAWNLMKDYAEYQGNFEIRGSRDATKEAFKMNIISDGEEWMDMILSRNKTSHSYNEDVANDIFLKIINVYHSLFVKFQFKMEEIRYGTQTDLFS